MEDTHALMGALADTFVGTLSTAMGNVPAIASPLLIAMIPLVVGMALILNAVGGFMPVGAVISSVLMFGICLYSINNWPFIVDLTIEQMQVFAGMSPGDPITKPWEIASAGDALITRIFDAAGAMDTYFGFSASSILFYILGFLVFLCTLLLSALSLVSWAEFWLAMLILGPLVALTPLVGFTQVGLAPITFMVSSAIKIAGISILAGLGLHLIAEVGFPTSGEEATWQHAMLTVGVCLCLLVVCMSAGALLSGIVSGRGPGWAGGIGALTGAIAGAGRDIMGSGRQQMSSRGVGGQAAHSYNARGGGGAGQGGTLGTQATPVNARRRP